MREYEFNGQSWHAPDPVALRREEGGQNMREKERETRGGGGRGGRVRVCVCVCVCVSY